jgi:competence protein ComEC
MGNASAKVVISHGDTDHSKFLPDLLVPVRVESLWLGGDHDEYPSEVLAWSSLVRDLGDAQWPRVTEEFEPDWHNEGYAVDELACGPASTFVLTVNSGNSKNANSLVLSIDHGDFRVIFTGDAEGATERAAMRNYPEPGVLVSTVVVSSHHGAQSEDSNHVEWIEATQPLAVIHSAGTRYGHPKCPVVTRFQEAGYLRRATPHNMSCGGLPAYASTWAEYNTHESGAVVITSDASLDSFRVECFPERCSE